MSLKVPEWRGKSAFFDDDILQQIYLLMSNASERITFVTPYIGLWEHFKSKLEEARRRKIEISFLTRDSEEERVPRKRPIQDLAWLKAHGVDVIEVPTEPIPVSWWQLSDRKISRMAPQRIAVFYPMKTRIP
jgi:hypothetical protein